MPMIKRDDHLSFAIHAYREQVALSYASKTASAIRRLAAQHGQYVRVLRRARCLDLVFSREPGFLLGEAVWRYFGERDDLIYCEVLSVPQQVLLVVVQAGRVHVDTKLSLAALGAELAALSLADRTYTVYVYGDLPMFDAASKAFALEGIKYQFIQSLEASVFESLPVYPDIQLQPLALALRSQYLGRRHWWPWAAVFLTVALVYGAWHALQMPAWQAPARATQQPVYGMSAHYARVMRGTRPNAAMHAMLQMMAKADALPGWRWHNVRWQSGLMVLGFEAQGGHRDALWRWTKALHGDLHMATGGATVTMPLRIASSAKQAVPPLAAITEWQARLLDQIHTLLPEDRVVVAVAKTDRALAMAKVTLSFAGLSPAVMDLVARRLARFPVTMEAMSWEQHEALYSGNIQFTLVGRNA